MPSPHSWLAAAAALAAALGAGSLGTAASACDRDCGGFGYAPGAYAPPVYSYAAPVDPYRAPPVYAYSYAAPYAYRPVSARAYVPGSYTAPVEIFRGPRWNWDAAYYGPRVYRGPCRRVTVCGRRAPRWHRAYVRGPVVKVWRSW
jgi:hypothetical protein